MPGTELLRLQHPGDRFSLQRCAYALAAVSIDNVDGLGLERPCRIDHVLEQRLTADPSYDHAGTVARTLAVQMALQQGRTGLLRKDYKAAVDVLEGQIAYVDGNQAYLAVLRDAYRAYIQQLELANQPTLAEAYRKRLAILEPAAAVIVPPPHEPVNPFAGDETARPGGRALANATPVRAVLVFGFVMVNVAVVEPCEGMVVGASEIPIDGGPTTVRLAEVAG